MIAFTRSQLLCCSTLLPAQYPVTTTLQPGALRMRSATTASNLLASSLSLTEFLAKLTLGRAPRISEQERSAGPPLPTHVVSHGHLPIPSASTGWQYVGVTNSLSLQSGTPSPSVSRVTPCVSTGQ